MKLDILAFGAHPDDVELGCGGTLAKLIKEGKKIGIIDLTRGELGTRGTMETRKMEAQEASEILGVQVRENLQMEDGFLNQSKEYQLKIIQAIRKYRPEIILSNAPSDRHPDHAKACRLVSDSAFLSGLVKIETHHENQKQEVWRPQHIFNYIQWEELKPDFVIDISDFIEVKKASCLAYKTQFYDPKSSEPNTPISSENFLESISYRAKNLGRLTGVGYAEGFIQEKTPVFKNFDAFIW